MKGLAGLRCLLAALALCGQALRNDGRGGQGHRFPKMAVVHPVACAVAIVLFPPIISLKNMRAANGSKWPPTQIEIKLPFLEHDNALQSHVKWPRVKPTP
jgi:hypothetical protein